MVKVKTDMTGWRMWEHGVPNSRWTVIKQVEDYINSSGKHFAQYLCECSCNEHNLRVITADNLKRGLSKSCGCWDREVASKTLTMRNKKYNTYDLSGEYGIGYLNNGEEFYFDLEDYELIKDYRWNIIRGYIVTDIDNTTVRLHRLVMGVTDSNIYVDHIQHNLKDNRKSQLRIVNPSQSCMNRGQMGHNTSGITGIRFNTQNNKWQAYIGVGGELMHLGYFDDKLKAIEIRNKAEEEYFGEYSYNNSIKGESI